MGRPSTFNQAIADAICEKLAEGNSLRSVCREDDMPVTSTVCKWLTQFPAFAEQYTRAREAMLDAQAEELEEIGDEAAQAETAVKVQGLRLKSDNRKWLLSKLAPKKYGDKFEANVSGSLVIQAAPLDEKL